MAEYGKIILRADKRKNLKVIDRLKSIIFSKNKVKENIFKLFESEDEVSLKELISKTKLSEYALVWGLFINDLKAHFSDNEILLLKKMKFRKKDNDTIIFSGEIHKD